MNPARGKSTTERPMLPIAILLWRDSWCRSHITRRPSRTLDNSSFFLSSLCDFWNVSITRLASIKNSTIANSTRKTAVSGELSFNRSTATFPPIRRERRPMEANNTSRFSASIVPASPPSIMSERTRMSRLRSAVEGTPRMIIGARNR